MENFKKDRNYYIDLIRGLAALSVILIHTAFHSGTYYVPKIVREFTLLFDVPVFIFLAGWAYSYVQNQKKYIKGLISLHFKHCIYLVIIFILILIANIWIQTPNPVNIKNLLDWITYRYSHTNPFPSVKNSLWFFPMYFVVVFAALAVINFTKRNTLKTICILSVFAILINYLNPTLYNAQIALGVDSRTFIFYIFFFLLGYLQKDSNLSFKLFLGLNIMNILLLITLYNFEQIQIFEMQKNKFPPSIIYLIWSLFGIYAIIFFKKYFKNLSHKNPLVKLGQNAIYIFFAQGISSSLLYYIHPKISLIWYLKFPLMFIINLILAILIMFVLKFIIELILKLPNKLHITI